MKNIEERLCYYDPRNPEYTKGTEKKEPCYCDNCFYGRTEMAEELLKQQDTMKTIDIQAKEWHDKVNGNSYFAAVVTINYGMKTEKQIKLPFQYGYGESYQYAAIDALIEMGLLPAIATMRSIKEQGIIYRSSIQRKCLKREVIAWGEES